MKAAMGKTALNEELLYSYRHSGMALRWYKKDHALVFWLITASSLECGY
jgi:hypothetical protein